MARPRTGPAVEPPPDFTSGYIPAGDEFTLQLTFPSPPDLGQIRATSVAGYTVSAPAYVVSGPGAAGGNAAYIPLKATVEQTVQQATAAISSTAAGLGATAATVVAAPGQALSAGARAVGDSLAAGGAFVGQAFKPAVLAIAAVLVILVMLRR